MAHLNESPPDPRVYNPNLEVGVRDAMLQALAKLPDERFDSAGTFVQALRQAWHTVKQTRQTETTLDALHTQAQTALKAEQWAELARLCLEMRALDPDYRDVTALLALATSRVLEEDKKRQQELMYRQQYIAALQLLTDHAYVEAIEALDSLPSDFADVAQKLQQARAGQLKVELYAQAKARLAEHLYVDACADLLALLEQDADYEDAADCLRAATAGVLEHLTAVKAELETVRAALEQSKGKNQDVYARVTALEAQLAETIAAHRRLEKVLRDTQKRLGDLETQAEDAKSQVAAYDQLLVALEDSAQESALALAKQLAKPNLPGATRVLARLKPGRGSSRTTQRRDDRRDSW